MIRLALLGLAAGSVLVVAQSTDVQAASRAEIDRLVTVHARSHHVPEVLVHRVIRRESGYNPRASSHGNFGLMQIRHGTAQGLGYRGPASGLLDAETNLRYGITYLAGALRVADGDQDRAVSLYARGYYYDAKRKGLTGRQIATGAPAQEASPPAVAEASAPQALSWLAALFGVQSNPRVAPQAPEASPQMEQAEDRVTVDPAPASTKSSRRGTPRAEQREPRRARPVVVRAAATEPRALR